MAPGPSHAVAQIVDADYAPRELDLPHHKIQRAVVDVTTLQRSYQKLLDLSDLGGDCCGLGNPGRKVIPIAPRKVA